MYFSISQFQNIVRNPLYRKTKQDDAALTTTAVRNDLRYKSLVLLVVAGVTLGRVLAVGHGDAVGVVRVGVKTPVSDDAGRDGAEGERGEEQDVRGRVRGALEAGVEGTGVRRVVEDGRVLARGGLVGAHDVAGLLGDEVEDVGAHVPSTERVEMPVGLDRAELGVVVVEVRVGGSHGRFGDGTAEEEAEDPVAAGVGVVLVKGDQDEGVLHEVRVVEQGLEEVASPGAGGGDRGVVSVRGHVGRDEHPLRQLLGLQVGLELRHVLDVRQTPSIGVGLEDDRWVVLSDVVVGTSVLVLPSEALEARVWHVFLVRAPGDEPLVEQVGDGRDVAGDGVEVVVVHSEVLTSVGSDIVGLRRGDTLAGEIGEVGVTGGLAVVGVLEPDGDETVKGQTGEEAGLLGSLGGCLSSVRRIGSGWRCLRRPAGERRHRRPRPRWRQRENGSWWEDVCTFGATTGAKEECGQGGGGDEMGGGREADA
nr:hypothetical protein CFP56_48688 [Quercus suber]